MQTLEQLQAENAALKADMKVIKTTVLTVTDGLKISTNGVFNVNMELGQFIKPVLTELSRMSKDAMLPDWMKSKNAKPNILSGELLSKLKPIIEKYKDL